MPAPWLLRLDVDLRERLVGLCFERGATQGLQIGWPSPWRCFSGGWWPGHGPTPGSSQTFGVPGLWAASVQALGRLQLPHVKSYRSACVT